MVRHCRVDVDRGSLCLGNDASCMSSTLLLQLCTFVQARRHRDGQSTPIFVQATPEIRANPWSFQGGGWGWGGVGCGQEGTA